MFEVFFSKEAEADLDSIRLWYRDIREGLELEFLMCIESEIEAIRRSPFIYKEYYKTTRKAIIDKFPYGIYYLLEENFIVIVAVAHHKRGKKVIRKKLKKK